MGSEFKKNTDIILVWALVEVKSCNISILEKCGMWKTIKNLCICSWQFFIDMPQNSVLDKKEVICVEKGPHW